MKRIATLLVATVLMLSGCQLVPLQAKEQMVSGAKKYCALTTPVERQILRDGANLELAKEDIVICGIKCPGQPAPVVKECQQEL
jgi:hypothetical protein